MARILYIFSVIVVLSSCSRKVETEIAPKNQFYTNAIKYKEVKKTDSAFLYFNKAKDWFLLAKDSLGVGKCLVNMANISINKGDYFGGQEIALQALNYLERANETHFPYLKANFNELGIASYNLKHYSQAILFYSQSLQYVRDSATVLLVRNNIANAYREKRDFIKSLAIYQDILNHNLNTEELSRVLTNFAFTKWLQNRSYDAASELLTGLHLREKENDLWGQNSSYAHLADYYMSSHPDSALFYATKMYIMAQNLDSPDDQLEALQKLVIMSKPKLVAQYFLIHQRLNDSLQTARNAAKNQFALIRYDAEKNKTDNLLLQKENAEKKGQITTQWILLSCAVFFIVSGGFWYKKRRRRLELEKTNAVQENQLKASKKVHDVVANGLYRVMSEVQYGNNLGKEELLDRIEDLYEQSRDIFNDKAGFRSQDFQHTVTTLLNAFDSNYTAILVSGNDAILWNAVSANMTSEIECILQELLVNMRKHSGASRVTVDFTRKNGRIDITYNDNGTGHPDKISYGNGLRNTENRIKLCRGTINFGSNAGKGLTIQISFPVT